MLGKIGFSETLNEHDALLSAEAAAGLPPGSLPLGTKEVSTAPLEADPDYDNFQGTTEKIQVTPPKRRRVTRNTEHFTQRINHLIDNFGMRDPVQVLMEIAMGQMLEPDGPDSYKLIKFDKTPDHKTRAFAATELCSYLYPKRKAVEVTGAEGQPITFAISADPTAIPQMPDEAEIKRLQAKRREEAAQAEKTLQGN